MTLPRVYIACLASYNSGILHGDWLDLDGIEDIEEFIENIILTAPVADAEEWSVHDHESCGQLSEHAGLSDLMEISEAYEACEHKHIDWDAFLAFCGHLGENPNEDQISKYEDAYAGSDKTLDEWCERFLDDTGRLENVDDHLRRYFNFEAYARDMEVNDVFTVDHNHDVLVFWRQ